MPKILIADDDHFERTMLKTLLEKRMGLTVIEAADGMETIAALKADKGNEIAAALLDLSMPRMGGHETLPHLQALRPTLPVIVITSTTSLEDAVTVMKLGATDLLPKPPDVELLLRLLNKALEVHTLRREVENLRAGDKRPSKFSRLIGNDPGLRTCVKLAQKAADSDVTVMITGESGVGKEVMAHAIHGESARSAKPFVAVNCGAIPKDLVESTLFGHKKGAFTGAIADALGKFREAEGGTLFLDEVGELPLETQVKLLRALQQREVEPVGARTSVPVNIRIIAATNRNLAEAVQKAQLRQDLFYRLNVFPLHIPPLRERASDILMLAKHFLRLYAAQEGRKIAGFAPATENWMTSHDWPGNVRELENKIYRAVLLSEGDLIELEHLLPIGQETPAPASSHTPRQMPHINLLDEAGQLKPMEQIRQEAVQMVMALHKNNIPSAAQSLGLGKSTLYRLIKSSEG